MSSVVNDENDDEESSALLMMKAFGSNYNNNNNTSAIERDRVLRKRGVKVRPSLIEYYSNSRSDNDNDDDEITQPFLNSSTSQRMSTNGRQQHLRSNHVNFMRGGLNQQDVNDIERTFDFLEEEY